MQALEVQAWGADGHRLIARVAEQQLSPAARAEVERLLALEPGSSLASISTWADEHRSPQTGRWHYVNFPRDATCTYEPQRDCEDGACVVEAIQRQRAVLQSAAPDEQRLKALKYLVHLVGDVHQPLHAGFADDRGGNSYQVQGFGRGSNLHSLWDSGLILNRPGGAQALQSQLAAEASNAAGAQAKKPASQQNPALQRSQVMAAARAEAEPAMWAQASCQIASAAGFYPEGHKVDERYAQGHDATLLAQLTAAARRLATVLNESLR
jgi:hypothetical protein